MSDTPVDVIEETDGSIVVKPGNTVPTPEPDPDPEAPVEAD